MHLYSVISIVINKAIPFFKAWVYLRFFFQEFNLVETRYVLYLYTFITPIDRVGSNVHLKYDRYGFWFDKVITVLGSFFPIQTAEAISSKLVRQKRSMSYYDLSAKNIELYLLYLGWTYSTSQ